METPPPPTSRPAGHRTPLTAADRERIAARRRAGERGTVLAAEYGVSPTRIKQIVRQEAARAQGPAVLAELVALQKRRVCQRPGCGKPARRDYCSRECAGLVKQQRTERACARPGCPNTFVVRPSEADRQYCSQECMGAVFTARHGALHGQRTCARDGCAETFWPDHEQRYCSRACSGLARRRREQRTCAHCARPFEVKGSRSRQVHYCSRACHDAAQRAAAVARGTRQAHQCTACGATFWEARSRPRRRCADCRHAAVGSRLMACEVCGAARRVYASDQAKGRGRFCSMACQRQAQRAARPTLVCARPGCGKTFEVKPSLGHRKYCSPRCRWPNRRRRPPRRRFTCARPGCETVAEVPGWQSSQRYCSPACFYGAGQSRNRTRDPQLTARDQRVLALHAAGLRAPKILAALAAERSEWGGYSAATIRGIIHQDKVRQTARK